MKVEYDSNNSGGRWWLKDEDWSNLEAVGWKVKWGNSYFCGSKFGNWNGDANKPAEACVTDCKGHWGTGPGERWLGALARSAVREGLTMAEAIREWETITGQDSSVLGCSCCGTPHSFVFTDEQGSREYYSPEYPTTGRRYE